MALCTQAADGNARHIWVSMRTVQKHTPTVCEPMTSVKSNVRVYGNCARIQRNCVSLHTLSLPFARAFDVAFGAMILPFLQPGDAGQALGVLLILIGFVGVFIPILPGPILIWAGALVWAVADKFVRVGWPTLIIMAVLMAIAWGSELALSTYFTRRSSSSWFTVLGSIVGGIIGGLLFTPLLPVIGSVAGAVLGAVMGVLVVELIRKRQVAPALRASGHYLVGCLFGRMTELFIALLMIALFTWQATT